MKRIKPRKNNRNITIKGTEKVDRIKKFFNIKDNINSDAILDVNESIIIKFQTQEKIENLYKGDLYVCPLIRYINFEKNSGIKDENEGTNTCNIKSKISIRNKNINFSEKRTYKINPYNYPIYCLYLPEQSINSDGTITLKNIPQNIIDDSYDTALIIDKKLFCKKIDEKCKINGYKSLFRKVMYIDNNDGNDDKLLKLPFIKKNKYSTQNEVRFSFYSDKIISENEYEIVYEGIQIKEDGEILFNLGSLEDCSKIVKISDLLKGNYTVKFWHNDIIFIVTCFKVRKFIQSIEFLYTHFEKLCIARIPFILLNCVVILLKNILK